MKRRFNLSDEEYEALARVAKCQVCGSTIKLCFDHNHRTGKVRGVLCDNCNKAAGCLGDDPNRIRILANYLEAA